MNSIKTTEPEKEKLFRHLLKNQQQENIAVLYCGYSKYKNDFQLLVRDVWLIEDADLKVHYRTGLEFTEEMYRKILLRCRDSFTSIIIAHSHPFAEHAWFSPIDDENDLDHGKFIKQKLPDIYYGNLVVAQKDYKARIFNKEKELFEDIQELRTLGKFSNLNSQDERPELDRNYRAFGRDGQDVISGLKVALVGCGGLGWFIAPMLLDIGVKILFLVDHDTIEISNMNRLVYAPYSELGKPKVVVMAELLRKMNPNVNVLYEVASVFDNHVLEQLKEYDVIIGATDNDRARFIINKFAVKYLKYYLDAGSGIMQENSKVIHAGGQVNVVIPGISPCLYCNNNLDWKIILYQSMRKEEQENEVKQGYIQGVNEPSPSVVSINGIIASALINEFIALTTGLKKANYYTYFDFMNEKTMMFALDVFKNEKCVICSKDALLGYGDVIKENKKSNKIPSFITEESHETRTNIYAFKQIESTRYKPVERNFVRTRIRPRYWYAKYI